jgi:predicted RNA binding protein YcfA (HicA-like mRNA interferase family)
MPISGIEMRKLFEKQGWIYTHSNGSHMILKKEGQGHISIPKHKELSKGVESKLKKLLQ